MKTLQIHAAVKIRCGGRDSLRKEEKEEEEENQKSGDSNYSQDMSQKEREGKSPGSFLLLAGE